MRDMQAERPRAPPAHTQPEIRAVTWSVQQNANPSPGNTDFWPRNPEKPLLCGNIKGTLGGKVKQGP